MAFTTASFGENPYDEALETAAASGWALYELPARHTVRTDAEAVTACAALAARLLQRGAVSYSERAAAGAPVTAEPHRGGDGAPGPGPGDPCGAAGNGIGGITVDTANRLQGREFDVVIVLHPLSGRRDATAFHLEAGRCACSPPGTATPASWSPGPASPNCSTPTPPPSLST